MSTLAYVPPAAGGSALRSTGMAGYCPWRHLGELDGVSLNYCDDGPLGLTRFSTHTITLRRGMAPALRRSVLAHEIAHIERGPAVGCAADDTGPTSVSIRAEERLVNLTAAVRLIPAWLLEDLPDLVAQHGVDAASAFLNIAPAMVRQAVDLCRAVTA